MRFLMTSTTLTEIERITEPTEELLKFLRVEMPLLSEKFGNKFNPHKCALGVMIEKGVFLVGRYKGEIRGIMIAWLYKSPLDIDTTILQQQLFYVKPDSGRTAFLLFHKFIDIGKNEANHIITMLTSHSNIKSSTLRRWGFKELETLYRMEVS